MNLFPFLAFLLGQAVPPHALLLAMFISYALGFAGMLLAYLNYRKRRGGVGRQKRSQPRP